jgi:hypothetical protein
MWEREFGINKEDEREVRLNIAPGQFFPHNSFMSVHGIVPTMTPLLGMKSAAQDSGCPQLVYMPPRRSSGCHSS